MDIYKQLVDRQSKVSIGYTKEETEHKEGDIFEEDGKQWQIKNGIKCSISKLKQARKYLQLPEYCPRCGNRMVNNYQNKKAWDIRTVCFDCMITEDNEKIISENFKQYEEEEIKKNFESYVNDVEQYLIDYVSNVDSKHFISETGEIEEWEHNPEEIKNKIKVYFEKLKSQTLNETQNLK